MRQPPVRRPSLLVLVMISSIGPLALQVLVPAMPGLASDFHTDFSITQMSLSVYLVGMVAGQLVYGPLSDRFGRRPVLMAGLVVYVGGTLFCLVAWDIVPLIIGRAFQALGGSAGIVLARAIIRDIHDREGSAQMLAYVTAGMILAPMIGAIAGGYLYEWYGWQSVMLLVLVIGVLVTGACIVALSETNTRRTSRTSFPDMVRDCAGLLRRRRFQGYALQVAFTTATFFTFLGGASAVAVVIYGRSPSEYALWFVLVSGSYMTGNFISGRISRRVGIDRMITIGTVASSTAALVMMVLFVSGWFGLVHFFVLAGMMSLGNGFSMPNGFAGIVSVDPGRAGTASGLSGALQMGLGAIAMTVVGHTMTESPMPVIVIMLVLALLALIAHLHGTRGDVP